MLFGPSLLDRPSPPETIEKEKDSQFYSKCSLHTVLSLIDRLDLKIQIEKPRSLGNCEGTKMDSRLDKEAGDVLAADRALVSGYHGTLTF